MLVPLFKDHTRNSRWELELPGIANDTVQQFQARVCAFDARYIQHWEEWLEAAVPDRPRALRLNLGRWQACRPNRMREIEGTPKHGAPYLDELVRRANNCIGALAQFDICTPNSFTPTAREALATLWEIFRQLSYYGGRGRIVRNGLAGVVGISKAVMLLTDGRVGPAFDSSVRDSLGIDEPENADAWIEALQFACADISEFQHLNQTTLAAATPPQFQHLHPGRIYDMALGPRPQDNGIQA